MSQFVGFGVQVELKDHKLITGRIAKANSKSLTLADVTFSDGGTSSIFKVKASRLRDLKVVSVPSRKKKQQPRKKDKDSAEEPDWQDDDVLRIKEGEDFDFQSNLAMFNKKTVFEQFKEQDSCDPSQRLVSHNKQEKPKLNYEIDEMIIPNAKHDHWDKIVEEQDTQTASASDGESEADFLPITKSINITHLLKGATGPSDTEEDDMIAKLQKVLSPIPSQTQPQLQPQLHPRSASVSKTTTFYECHTRTAIPLATPVQLLEIDRVATDTYKFPTQLSLEHIAIKLSHFIKNKLGGKTRLHKDNSNPQPLVVILTSDNRCGARALALGRLLCQNNLVRVITCFTTSALPSDEEVLKQLDMFKLCGGKIVESMAMLNSTLEKLNSPVELIVDAMQGFDCNLEDLCDTEEQLFKIEEMIDWCNATQTASVWSLDIPSGIDGASGFPNCSVHVKSNVVASLGWPLVGLLNMAQQGHVDELYLVDVGIPSGVYTQRNSLRKFQGVELFTAEGIIPMEL